MTSKLCILGRYPNTYMNTIKKTFRAVSKGAKFHLHLLVQNVVSTQFHIDVPSNDPFFARACKDFSSVCPTSYAKPVYKHHLKE